MMHKSERHFPRNNSFDLNFFPWTNAERNTNNSFLYRDSKFDMHITNKTEIVFPIVHIYMLQSLSRIVSRLFKISHPYIYIYIFSAKEKGFPQTSYFLSKHLPPRALRVNRILKSIVKVPFFQSFDSYVNEKKRRFPFAIRHLPFFFFFNLVNRLVDVAERKTTAFYTQGNDDSHLSLCVSRA